MNIDYLIRLLLATACGALLGLERKSKQHTVGPRTLILISLSSALLTILSIVTAAGDGVVTGDCTRITAGIVTGIGFLGAGAIIKSGLNIRGLTTAGVVWSAAALGISAGAGQYILTVVTLILILLSLLIFSWVEHKSFPQEKSKILSIVYGEGTFDIQTARKILRGADLIERDLNITQTIPEKKSILRFWIKVPSKLDLPKLTQELLTTGNVTKVSLSDE